MDAQPDLAQLSDAELKEHDPPAHRGGAGGLDAAARCSTGGSSC